MQERPRPAATWFVALLLALTAVGAAAKEAVPEAADPALEARMTRITSELRCLVCQNQTIADSSADLAADLRRQTRELLKQGKSDQEIVDYMTARYGDFVLYRPPLRRRRSCSGSARRLMLVVGAAVLVLVLRRRSRMAGDAFEADDDDDRDMLAGQPGAREPEVDAFLASARTPAPAAEDAARRRHARCGALRERAARRRARDRRAPARQRRRPGQAVATARRRDRRRRSRRRPARLLEDRLAVAGARRPERSRVRIDDRRQPARQRRQPGVERPAADRRHGRQARRAHEGAPRRRRRLAHAGALVQRARPLRRSDSGLQAGQRIAAEQRRRPRRLCRCGGGEPGQRRQPGVDGADRARPRCRPGAAEGAGAGRHDRLRSWRLQGRHRALAEDGRRAAGQQRDAEAGAGQHRRGARARRCIGGPHRPPRRRLRPARSPPPARA